MNQLMRHLLLIAFTCHGMIARADEAADREALTRLQQKMAEHLVKQEVEKAVAHFVEDWAMISADGSKMTRTELVSAITSGKLMISSYRVSDLEVRVYGDAAVVVGIGASQGSWDGEEFREKERFSDFFIRKDGKWMCVASHSSVLDE